MMSPDDAAPRARELLFHLQNNGLRPTTMPFKDMTEAQTQEVMNRAGVQILQAGGTCFEEGDAAEHFFLLVEGTVRIVRTTADGEQVIVLHVLPGQLFGVARAFANDCYKTTARVVVDGIALSWPSDLWDQFARDYPAFLTTSREVVGTRVSEMQDTIVAMATLKVEQRIAHAIRDLVQKAGLPTKDGIEIGFPITRQDISEMTGTTLHSVSRYMSQWQKNGIVNSKRRRVIVTRPESLPV